MLLAEIRAAQARCITYHDKEVAGMEVVLKRLQEALDRVEVLEQRLAQAEKKAMLESLEYKEDTTLATDFDGFRRGYGYEPEVPFDDEAPGER